MEKRKSPSYSSCSPLSICTHRMSWRKRCSDKVDRMVNMWTRLATPRIETMCHSPQNGLTWIGPAEGLNPNGFALSACHVLTKTQLPPPSTAEHGWCDPSGQAILPWRLASFDVEESGVYFSPGLKGLIGSLLRVRHRLASALFRQLPAEGIVRTAPCACRYRCASPRLGRISTARPLGPPHQHMFDASGPYREFHSNNITTSRRPMRSACTCRLKNQGTQTTNIAQDV